MSGVPAYVPSQFAAFSRRPAALAAATFLVAFLFAVFLQWHGDAYEAGWSGSPDESGHYVTGLLVRDYVSSGFHEPPMVYARRYYEHYPRVSLGHWPPMFYIVQAGWTGIFGVSTASLLTLMAVFTALLTAFTCSLIARARPAWIAFCCTLLLWATPLTVHLNRMLMSDVLVALFVLAAIVYLAHYLETPHWRPALAFGLAAAAALMTKGSAIILAPAPILAVLLERRPGLLLRRDFWLPAVVVAIVCGPWYALAPGAHHERALPGKVITFNLGRIQSTMVHLAEYQSLAAMLLILASLVVLARRISRGGLSHLTCAGIALCAGALFCRVLLNPWEPRHLFMLLPIFCYASAVGTGWLHRVVFGGRKSAAVLLAAVLLATTAFVALGVPPKPRTGIPAAARQLLAAPDLLAGNRILVVAEPGIESLFVAAIAEIDQRPNLFVERAWKTLTSPAGMLDAEFRPIFSNSTELMAHFSRKDAFTLVIEEGNLAEEHVEMVRETIRRFPNSWKMAARLNAESPRAERKFEVFHLRRNGYHATP